MDDLSNELFIATSTEPKPYAVQVQVALILMAIVGVIAVLPFFGFFAWILAGPMMLVSFIMIIMVFSKGGVKHGLLLLFCQIIVMPAVIIGGPVISSALGLTGAVAVAVNASDSSGDTAPAAIPYQSEISTVPDADALVSGQNAAAHLPPELLTLKELIVTQQAVLQQLKNAGTTREAASGFLALDEKLEIAARKVVLQENLWREQVFKQIAVLTQQTPEEVAAEFARLAASASTR